MVTHNETSTGVTHPLEEIARITKQEFDKLLLVDAVSSLGCIPLARGRLGLRPGRHGVSEGFHDSPRSGLHQRQ